MFAALLITNRKKGEILEGARCDTKKEKVWVKNLTGLSVYDNITLMER